MWIFEVNRQKCVGEIHTLSFILCLSCQGEHLFQLGIYSNKSSSFSVFWLIPNYLRREEEIQSYCVLTQKGQQTKSWITLLRGPGFMFIRQRASLSLIFDRKVLAVQSEVIMTVLLHFVLHRACLWQGQKNGSVDELGRKKCARLLLGYLVFETCVVYTLRGGWKAYLEYFVGRHPSVSGIRWEVADWHFVYQHLNWELVIYASLQQGVRTFFGFFSFKCCR